MHSLLGDRFLKRFAGDVRRRQDRSTTNVAEQDPPTDAEPAGGMDRRGREEDRGQEAPSGADPSDSGERYEPVGVGHNH